MTDLDGSALVLNRRPPSGPRAAGRSSPKLRQSRLARRGRSWQSPWRRVKPLWKKAWKALRGVWIRLEINKYTPDTYPDYLRQRGAQVGQNCRIASFGMDIGVEPYLLKIGNRVQIEEAVSCLTHDGAAWVFRLVVPDVQVYGSIVIEDDCRIGYGAILCPGVRIGRNALVAAGSVVICDVPPGSAVIGIPARPCVSLDKLRPTSELGFSTRRPS